jgi:hypothetical protein
MTKIFRSIIVVIFLMACKKEEFKDIRRQAVGTWEYHRIYCFCVNPLMLPRGNGQLIVIGWNGSFDQRKHDTVTYRGSYQFNKRKDCRGDIKDIFFETSNPNFTAGKISIKGDTLRLSQSNCLTDPIEVIYLKN